MRAIYPLLLAGLLGFITMESYGQCENKWNSSLSISDNETLTSDGSCVYGTVGTDLTYSLSNLGRTLTVENDVTINVGDENTFAITGSSIARNFVLEIEENATLTINGNFRMNYHCDLKLDGKLIVKGDLNTAGWDFLMNFDLGDNAILVVEGDANFNRGYGSNTDHIYVLGQSSSELNNFTTVNVGSDPFSNTKALDFDESSTSIDFWDDTKLVASDRSSNKVSAYLLSNLTINSSSGWYGKYLKVTAYGFDADDIVMPDQSGGAIQSIQELKSRIGKVKWDVQNATVKNKIDRYHVNKNNGEDDDDDLSGEGDAETYTYLTKSRKIVIEFVDTYAEVVTTYPEYLSGGRLNGIMSIDEIEVSNNNVGDLPIELSSFTVASTDQQSVALSWTSAMEINNDYYEVLRSVDQANWESIGIISGAGNSNYAIDYTFIDEEPLSRAYYQLVQYDFDGGSEAFGPLFISLQKDDVDNFQVKTYPNVIHDEPISLSIQDLSTTNAIMVQVIDNMGSIVYQEEIENLAKKSILKPVQLPSNLPSGMYFMIVKAGRQVAKNKLILQ
ncbi:T9SS type A sorting domain-containing protein [Flammeovirga sp. EKP202]|uniref:T9SS type A sorting domain-containing protein n=1 Tax=Flammeovirga sp. EKP202 TaxID=2770592 RepID=UPI00165FF3DB|nr:T9SS type A sorting domain-containing protein [Flammeovirga sp. EKP202]MBD0399922.1 T9SS type A sorting domain-containing protein [Flammeovirga sp. EKP202]